jgi:hypothetical protein
VPGELARLFTRTFAIGYLLPAAALLLALYAVLDAFGLGEGILRIVTYKDSYGALLALAVAWFVAILLLAINRPTVRLLAGYGRLNPLRLGRPRHRKSFRKRHRTLAAARPGKGDAQAVPGDAQVARSLWELARDFPDDEALVLPTKFGNVVRAFEVYPRVIYGLEYTYAWARLVGVIPSEYREMIDNEKSQMDFWVNTCLGACVTVALYLSLAIVRGAWPQWGIAIAALAVAVVSVSGACALAKSWGLLVTSAFDLFRSDLCRQLGLRLPPSLDEERELWESVSQVWVYRSPNSAQRLTKFRQTDETPKA